MSRESISKELVTCRVYLRVSLNHLKSINPETSWFGWMCSGHVWEIMEHWHMPLGLFAAFCGQSPQRAGRVGRADAQSLLWGRGQRTWAFWSALNEEKMWWDDMSQWWSSRLNTVLFGLPWSVMYVEGQRLSGLFYSKEPLDLFALDKLIWFKLAP